MRTKHTYAPDYSRQILHFLLVLAIVIAVTGCWREVEYTEPVAAEPSSPQAEVAASAADEQVESALTDPGNDEVAAAGAFGDDLASSLASDEPATAMVDPADTTPIDDTDPTSAEVVGDRYAAKPPTTETPDSEPAQPAESTPSAGGSFDSLFDEPSAEEFATAESPAAESEETAEPSAAAETAATTPPADETIGSLFGESDATAPATPGENTVDDSMLPEEREAIAETSDETIANLDDDDVPTPPVAAARNTRRAAWLLGSKLSLAALASDYDAPAAEVQRLFDQSRTLAGILSVTMPALPARSEGAASSPSGRPALKYLLGEPGQAIGRELARGEGARQAALFEVAVKSNLILVLYEPGASTTEAIAAAIERAAPRGELPARLWQPLLDALASRASLADVRKAVYQLHADVDKYLAEPVE